MRRLMRWVRSWSSRPEAALFAICLGSYAYFYQAGGWNQNSRFDLVRALVERGTPAIDAYEHNTGDKARRAGHTYCDKAPGLSLLGVPAYAEKRQAGRLVAVRVAGTARLVAGVVLVGVDRRGAALDQRAHEVEARVLIPSSRLVEVRVGAEADGEERSLGATRPAPHPSHQPPHRRSVSRTGGREGDAFEDRLARVLREPGRVAVEKRAARAAHQAVMDTLVAEALGKGPLGRVGHAARPATSC